MRDQLNKSLEVLIWMATVLLILFNCYVGYSVLQVPMAPPSAVVGAFLGVVLGVTLSLVFAGICFQVMDIRAFTKFMAIDHKKGH